MSEWVNASFSLTMGLGLEIQALGCGGEMGIPFVWLSQNTITMQHSTAST